MRSTNYQYGTTPRKIEPDYRTKQKRKASEKYQKQLEINEQQKKDALKLEKKKNNKNVVYVLAIFAILLTISYRSSLINEKFNELQDYKEELAAIEKTNGQLEVSIESSLNLSNIEEAAESQLGMQKLDNNQKVYVTLDKKDYVEGSSDDVDTSTDDDETWYQSIINKILRK